MDDALLTKYLLKETNETEDSAVRQWIEADPEHERRYQHVKHIWDVSKSLEGKLVYDETMAWNRFVERRDSTISIRKLQRENPMSRLRWIRYAAAILLIPLGAGLAYYWWNTGSRGLVQAVYETAATSRTDTLADGTVITLNRHAALRYKQDPSAKQREATLDEGEVFFNVKRDPDQPFVVKSGNVAITVLGTSFHVKRKGDETYVTVETGRVRVVGAGQQVELTARQAVSVNTLQNRFETSESSDRLHNYYVSNKFVLENTPLSRVVEVLSDAYGVDIRIENPQVRDLPLTTTFEREDLDEILQVISKTFRIQVVRKGDAFILK